MGRIAVSRFDVGTFRHKGRFDVSTFRRSREITYINIFTFDTTGYETDVKGRRDTRFPSDIESLYDRVLN